VTFNAGVKLEEQSEKPDQAAVGRFYELYARVVDAQDYSGLAAMCAPDVRLILNGDEYEGVDNLVAAYRAALEPASGSRHLITNVGLDLSDGIRARTYLMVVWWSDAWTRQGVGCYDDDLAWADGKLVFAVKRIALEHVMDLSPLAADA
jgi:hypothetical protein